MSCPRCGSTAPPLQGVCMVCGLRVADGTTVGVGTLTPPPPAPLRAPQAETRRPSPPDGEDTPRAAASTGPDAQTRPPPASVGPDADTRRPAASTGPDVETRRPAVSVGPDADTRRPAASTG